MKDFFRDILSDKTITSAFLMNIFFIVTSLVYILFSFGKLPPLIPIFNQLPWGEQRLGTTLTIFIPVLISLFILAINIFIAASVYKKIPLISRMFAGVSLLMGILTFLFVVRIITLII
jgi:hypothetical protein